MKKRLARAVYEAPPKVRGGRVANALGLQAVRMAGYQARRAWRRRRATGRHADELRERGITVIHDFLSPGQWAAFQAELPRMRAEAYLESEARPRAWQYEVHKTGRDGLVYRSEVFTRPFLEGSGLYDLAQTVVGHKVHAPPTISLMIHSYAKEDLGKPMLDFQDHPHVDVQYPTMKAVLYITDTDARNGAFEYAPGSHRMTWARFKEEQRHTVRAAAAKRRGENHLARLGLEAFPGEPIRPIEAPANSLVVFNAMGLHRRGDFQDDRVRETLFINFRRADAPFHRLLAFPPTRRLLRRWAR